MDGGDGIEAEQDHAEAQLRHHADRDGLSVVVRAVSLRGFERVSDRVPEVQGAAHARVALVLRDEPRLRHRAGADQRRHSPRIERASGCATRLRAAEMQNGV